MHKQTRAHARADSHTDRKNKPLTAGLFHYRRQKMREAGLHFQVGVNNNALYSLFLVIAFLHLNEPSSTRSPIS